MPDIAGSDDVDSPYYNPFLGAASQSSFTSAVTSKDALGNSRPLLRRRGSESSAKRSRNDHDPRKYEGEATNHARARTMDGATGSSSGARAHPLAHSNLGSSTASSRSSLIDTRPRLKRLLSDILPDALVQDESRGVEEPAPSNGRNGALKERVVIVHEVSHKDSLAGVALKYGISLADLRKANQLWTTDPIHLRKVLYIPLDKSHKAKELVLSHLEQSAESLASDDTDSDLALDGERKLKTEGPGPPLTIRRVPVSQLSFFPPPSSSSLSSQEPDARTLPRSFNTSKYRDLTPFTTVPPSSSSSQPLSIPASVPSTNFIASTLSHFNSGTTPSRSQIPSLSTIFNALPLARISFDSGTSTPSQISDDQEHEMNDVSGNIPVAEDRVRARSHEFPFQRRVEDTPITRRKELKPRASQDALELRSYAPSLPQQGMQPDSGGRRGLHNKSNKYGRSAAYASPERSSQARDSVRTSQMEPSPAMQLPLGPRGGRDG